MKERVKEWIKYGSNGVLTTIVNYALFFTISNYIFINSYLLANTIAWIGAVLFAYYTNKKWVFKNMNQQKHAFISFVSLRFVTLVIENIALYICITTLDLPAFLSKCLVSVLTIVGNYMICKQKIFNKEGEQVNEPTERKNKCNRPVL